MKKIIVASPDYTTKYGGIVVLHKLSHILNEIGFDSYMVNHTGDARVVKLNNNFNTKNINASYIDKEHDIIIYPEIVKGNPYNVNKSVRYVLYYNKLQNTYTTWGDNDFWIYYGDEFYDGMRDKNILTIYDTKVHYFRDLNENRHIKSCFLIKKGNDYNHVSKNYHPVNSLEINNWEDSYLLDIFNRCETFYSYDYNTYISIIAALCGCKSIIVPLKNISANDFRATNVDRAYGIAYGSDDIQSCNTLDSLRTSLINKETEQCVETSHIITKIIEYFNENISNYIKS